MKYAVTVMLLLLAIGAERGATAQSPGRTYPRVYGPTGRLYGSTQADYQYQRQYLRPWHGMNGLRGGPETGNVNGSQWRGGHYYHAGSYSCSPYIYPPVYAGGFGYGGYGGYGYGGYGPAYGGYAFAPTWQLLNPIDTTLPLDQQAVMQDWLRDESRQWTSPLDSLPVEQLPRRFIKPSTDAAKVRSVRLQHEGDLHFQNLEFDAAGRDYEAALMAAQDLPEPYFRLGIIEAARGDFTSAVLNLKLGLQLNPDWPHTGPTLDELIGQQNGLPKLQVKQQLLDWVQQDIRDPERLFLLGVFLHIDNDAARAAEVFETAARLGGMKQHLHAFLSAPSGTQQAAAPAEQQPPPAVEQAPPPAPGLDEEPQPAPILETPPITSPPATGLGPQLPTSASIIPPPAPTK